MPARAILTSAWVNRGSLVLMGPIGDFIVGILDGFSLTELNRGEERAIAQWRANFDPPKNLEELRVPNPDRLGYEPHHIVEQNPANRAKFGDDAIDDPSNIVYVPRLKHEEVTARFNRKAADDPSDRRIVRDVISNMDFQEQREKGLEVLRDLGVLK